MIKIGIIGAGRIGKVHLQSITYHVKGATVKSIADPFMNEETEAFVKSMGVEVITKDKLYYIIKATKNTTMQCFFMQKGVLNYNHYDIIIQKEKEIMV